MNLNDVEAVKRQDPDNMLGHIDGLPDQLESAWELGARQPLPDWEGIQQVVVAGVGGSAIGADLVRAYVEPTCRVPLIVHRDYHLPAWAVDAHTLVVTSSHSGNTEETLTAFEAARKRSCNILVLTTGGELSSQGERAGMPVWRFEHHGQPRTAVGFSFGLLLAALWRLGLIPNPEEEIRDALSAMRTQQEKFQASVPDVNNPAKRMAGQLVNRWVAILGAEMLAPVARRWKGQISEVAKTWAQFEELPEADHNTLAGIFHPETNLSNLVAIFLRAPTNQPRNQLRIELTKKTLMLQGIGTDFIDAVGRTRLANQWTCLHYGDYVSYYLAMAYREDPTPIESIEGFKREMAEAGN
jgi:glucose/mannose-6-phosphate isomerase